MSWLQPTRFEIAVVADVRRRWPEIVPLARLLAAADLDAPQSCETKWGARHIDHARGFPKPDGNADFGRVARTNADGTAEVGIHLILGKCDQRYAAD